MNLDRYTNKIVVVTGSSRGIGKLTAEHFLKNGATVIGMSRGDGSISSSAYHHYTVDITYAASVETAFFKIRQKYSRLDILISNASVLTSQYAMIMPFENSLAMINTNLIGTINVTKEAAKLMKAGKWGRIISIGSMAKSLEPAGDSVYAASKAGAETYINVVAREFGKSNITCNTLAVSAYPSEMLLKLPQDKIQALIETLPIPRFATAADITNAIDFFASEESAAITAQTIYLNGVN